MFAVHAVIITDNAALSLPCQGQNIRLAGLVIRCPFQGVGLAGKAACNGIRPELDAGVRCFFRHICIDIDQTHRNDHAQNQQKGKRAFAEFHKNVLLFLLNAVTGSQFILRTTQKKRWHPIAHL